MLLKFLLTCLLAFFVAFVGTSQEQKTCNHSSSENIRYIENKGQWPSQIKYKTGVNSGEVYLESNGFTFTQHSSKDLVERGRLYHSSKDSLKLHKVQGHAWKVNFVNSNKEVRNVGLEKHEEYYNYFLGKNEKNWASNVGLYQSVLYEELYAGIDLKAYSSHQNFKYDFIVNPNADPNQIALNYEGLDGIFLKDEHLVLVTSVGEFKEMKPYAFQVVNNEIVEVECQYVLSNNLVKFYFPKGYNKALQLIIDPVLIASTLSGTSGFYDNYGHGATFDNLGNIYTAAVNFGGDYPSTVGSFQLNYAGGITDIVLSKLNPDGSALIYATYIGGDGDDFPHSVIVNDNYELYVLGSSSSTNYPCSAGAYDNSFGGTTDIVISHLNSTGSGLIGSTYLGNADTDGNNYLTFNYGDQYRGEIVLDASGNCYIASCAGAGFPTTAGAYQTVFGGGSQDAVFFKMNPTMSSLLWSTYLGGIGDDSGFGLRLDANGDVYACGGTNDNFLNANGYQTTNQGGTDGFVVKITNNGGAMPNRTYLGIPDDDVLFFLDIDDIGRINVYGHVLGFGGFGATFAATPGAYNMAGSGQHIACFNTTLTNLEFMSIIGGGTLGEFIPIAFMVDVCGNIYFSGHSATFGLPTSANALFTSGGFYVGALAPNATALSYATYYTGDHVDGGTSRFDPEGTIYQGVCSGGGFNTTANAFSPNQVTAWDIAVFKIDFEMQGVMAVASVDPSTSGCAPFTVDFTNESTGALSYAWNFDDGSPISTVQEPTHTFTTPGVYDVMLAAINPASCNYGDTTFVQITVVGAPTVDLGPDTTFCQGSVTLNAGALAPYLWSTGATSQTINVNSTGTYWVQVGNAGCQGSDTINVNVSQLAVDLGSDILFCNGVGNFPITLDAGVSNAQYVWSSGEITQTIAVNAPGTYSVLVDDGLCQGTDQISIAEISGSVSFSVEDTIGCAPVVTHFYGEIVTSENIASYAWDFGDGGTSNLPNPAHNYAASGAFNVTFTVTTDNGCEFSFTRIVNIFITPQPLANFDILPSTPILGEPVFLMNESLNATDYSWSLNGVSIGNETDASFSYTEEGMYTITLIATNGSCVDTVLVSLNLEEDLIFYVPNTFTPDNDEFNQQFTPVFTSGFDPTHYQLMIFNRWGEMVFESFNSKIGWDGTYGGKKSQDGTYTWKIIFKEKYSDKRRIVLGHLNLLR